LSVSSTIYHYVHVISFINITGTSVKDFIEMKFVVNEVLRETHNCNEVDAVP